jgi:hypothetical protein
MDPDDSATVMPPDEPIEEVAEEPAAEEAPAEPAPQQVSQAPNYPPDQNLVPMLEHRYLNAVGKEVLETADRDYESCKDWREKAAEHLELYNSDVADMPDQPNISVMQFPWVRRAVRMYKGRMFPDLFPADGEIVQLTIDNPDPVLQEAVDKCTMHMNQQLVNEIPEYIPSHDRGMSQTLIWGFISETWYYDPSLGRPCNEICLAEDFWFSYRHKSDRPDMGDVPRLNWRKRMQQHELEEWEANGAYYVGITQDVTHPDGGITRALFPADSSYTEAGTAKGSSDNFQPGQLSHQPVKEVADENAGTHAWMNDPEGDRIILEQDRWLRLPGEKRQRPVTICLDAATGRVVRLVLREMEDARDKLRADNELRAAEAEHEANVAQMQAEHEGQIDEFRMSQEALGFHPDLVEQQVATLPPFQAPEFKPPEIAPPKRVPWNRWTKYECDVNPTGALGQGLPHDVAGQNVFANKLGTRGVSLLTMALQPTGIQSRQSRFTRGEVQLKLGRLNEINMSPDQVSRGAGISWLQTPIPPNGWEKPIEMADHSSQEVTAFDIVAGGPGMSGETATESENRHAGAVANISMVGGRYNRARAASLKNLAYINSLTLPPEGVTLYREVPAPPPMPPAPMGPMPGEMAPMDPNGGAMDPLGEMPPEAAMMPPPEPQETEIIEVKVTREDYQLLLDNGLQVTFTSDPSMESPAIQERRAMKLFQTAMQIVTTPAGPEGPPVLPPELAVQMIRLAGANVFKAARAPKSWIRMLETAPAPTPPPMMGPEPGGGPNGEAAEGGGPEGGPPGMVDEGGGGVPEEPAGPVV